MKFTINTERKTGAGNEGNPAKSGGASSLSDLARRLREDGGHIDKGGGGSGFQGAAPAGIGAKLETLMKDVREHLERKWGAGAKTEGALASLRRALEGVGSDPGLAGDS